MSADAHAAQNTQAVLLLQPLADSYNKGNLMLCESINTSDTSLLAVIGMPGPVELLVVAGIILLLFGKRLPEVMGSLGRSIVEFKKGASEDSEQDNEDASQSKVTES